MVDEISKKAENGNLKNGNTDEADHKVENSKEAENGNSTGILKFNNDSNSLFCREF